MSDLETKLENILKKIKNPKTSLSETNDLYFETEKILDTKKDSTQKEIMFI